MKAAIHSFGRYLPRNKIRADVIAQQWKRGPEQADALGIQEKTVPSSDEDTMTMAWEAATQAIERSSISREDIGAVFVGSESHPYAVKPTSGMLVSALSLTPFCRCADLEFACKAGTAAMQIVMSMVESRHVRYGLAIGSDTAQAKPGDALEYAAAAGAAAFLIGPSLPKCTGLCRIESTLSYTTDTPDFWRGSHDRFPSHAGRFTGEPAYFHHVETAATALMEREGVTPHDIQHVIFHMPNAKFPQQVAKKLGFSQEQLRLGFIVPMIGNTYSACSPIGLTRVLEEGKKNDRILLVSYGSGAGSDAFLLTMMSDGTCLPPRKAEDTFLSYAEYAREMKLLSE